MKIAIFGSSILSAYWNGAATYYRGITRALSARGHRITFYEPDAYNRQQHRDLESIPWAQVVVYKNSADFALKQVDAARDADLIIKASGVGVFDELLESAVLAHQRPSTLIAFWDVDAPATLERVAGNKDDAFRSLIPRYDIVFTYGGGTPVIAKYLGLGARQCVPIYNGLDPATHFQVEPESRFKSSLSLLANRLPDREERISEFFFDVSKAMPECSFLLAGSGWETKDKEGNVRNIGHLQTADHNAFNSSAKAVLNVCRESMARNGFSPATRVFEAAGSAACIITDAWDGIDHFFEPGVEVLVAQNGLGVVEHLRNLTPARAGRIGENAYRRVRSDHTYAHRAAQMEKVLHGGISHAAAL